MQVLLYSALLLNEFPVPMYKIIQIFISCQSIVTTITFYQIWKQLENMYCELHFSN